MTHQQTEESIKNVREQLREKGGGNISISSGGCWKYVATSNNGTSTIMSEGKVVGYQTFTKLDGYDKSSSKMEAEGLEQNLKELDEDDFIINEIVTDFDLSMPSIIKNFKELSGQETTHTGDRGYSKRNAKIY